MTDGEEYANSADGSRVATQHKLVVQTMVGQGGSVQLLPTSLARDREDPQQAKVSVFKKISPAPGTPRSNGRGATRSHESSRRGSLKNATPEALKKDQQEQRKGLGSAGGRSHGVEEAREVQLTPLDAAVVLTEAAQSLGRPPSPGTAAALSAPGQSAGTKEQELQQPTVPKQETTTLGPVEQRAPDGGKEKPVAQDPLPTVPTPGLEKKLDELRIVKSTHSKLKRRGTENEHPEDRHPREPGPQQLDFLSVQQQRAFVPDESLVLMGELKPTFFKTRTAAQRRGRGNPEPAGEPWRRCQADAASQASPAGDSVQIQRNSVQADFAGRGEESNASRTSRDGGGIAQRGARGGSQLRLAGRASSLARVTDQVTFKDGSSHRAVRAQKQCECGERRGTEDSAAKPRQHTGSHTLHSFHKSLLAQNQNHRKFFFELPSQSPSSSKEAPAARQAAAFQKSMQLQPTSRRQKRSHRNDVAPATRTGAGNLWTAPRRDAYEEGGVHFSDADEGRLPATPSTQSNWRAAGRMHQSQNFTTPLRDLRPSEHLQLPRDGAEPRSVAGREQTGGPFRPSGQVPKVATASGKPGPLEESCLDELDLLADGRKPSVAFLSVEEAAPAMHEQTYPSQRSRTPFNQASRGSRNSRLAHTASHFKTPAPSVALAPAAKGEDGKDRAIETRIMNQLRRELEEQEYEIYKQYGKLAQLFNDGSAHRRFNLTSLPEWIGLTTSLHKTTLASLESFSSKILSQNYYEIDTQSSKISAPQVSGPAALSPSSQAAAASVFTAASSSRYRPAQQAVTPRGEFLNMFIARIQKSFTQNEQALTDAHQQLAQMKLRVADLEKELDGYKALDFRAKTKAEVIQQIVEDYFTRVDGDCASERLREAEAFLAEALLVPQEEIMRRDRIEAQMDYHRADAILEVVDSQLTASAVHEIRSGLREIKLDPDFAERLRTLFAKNFQEVQSDAALKVARLMYKDVTLATQGVQASEQAIDAHLLEQIAEEKAVAHEWQMRLRDQVAKTAALEGDLTRMATALAESEKEGRQRDHQLHERDKEASHMRQEIWKLKATADTKEKEGNALSHELARSSDQADRYKEAEGAARRLVEKAKQGNAEKARMLSEQGELVLELEALATDEQRERIRIVNLMHARVAKLDRELDESIRQYAKRSLTRRTSAGFEPGEAAEALKDGEEGGETPGMSPLKLGMGRRRPGDHTSFSRAPSGWSEVDGEPASAFSPAAGSELDTPTTGKGGGLSSMLGAALGQKARDDGKGSSGKKKKKKKKAAKGPLASKVGAAALKKSADLLTQNADLLTPEAAASDEDDEGQGQAESEGSAEEETGAELASSGQGATDGRVAVIQEQLDEDSGPSISLRRGPHGHDDDQDESAEEYQGTQQARIKEIQHDELGTHRDEADSAREHAAGGYTTFGRSDGTLERLNSLAQSSKQRVLSNDRLASLPQTELDSNDPASGRGDSESGPLIGQGVATKARKGDQVKAAKAAPPDDPQGRTSRNSRDTATIQIKSKDRHTMEGQPPACNHAGPFGFGTPTVKVDREVQTDSEKFFSYVLDLLSLLESRIASGDITIDQVIELGHQALDEEPVSRWAYGGSPQGQKKDAQAILELQQCLAKIKSMRAYGGDVFFAGLGRVFAAQPVVPQSYDRVKSVLNKDGRPKNKVALQVRQVKDLEQLKAITRVRFAAGGGVGEAGRATPKPHPPKEDPLGIN